MYKVILISILLLIGCKNPNKGQTISNTQNSISISDSNFPSDSLGNILSFAVDSVERATDIYRTFPAEDIIESKIGKRVYFIPNEIQNQTYINCYNNGLIETVRKCYATHRPLVLTPDVIWLTITQGVSIHINQNFKSLEPVLFSKNRPKTLEIRNDSLDQKPEAWQQLMSDFSHLAEKYTKPEMQKFFVPSFSTTHSTEQTVYQITQLEAYKQAFEYMAESGCGIPEIKLRGTKEDWEALYAKLDGLKEFGLQDWAEELKPIIRECIQVYDQKIDKKFWQRIYKDYTEYNAFYISGWIIKFFPYTVQTEMVENSGSEDEMPMTTKVYLKNEFIYGDDYLLSTLSSDNFPSGLAEIEVVWNNYFNGTRQKVQVYGGFMGIKQYKDLSLEPMISWAVCKPSAEAIDPYSDFDFDQDIKEVKHGIVGWIPDLFDNPEQKPIYDAKNHKTPEEGNQFVIKFLEQKLTTAFPKKDFDLPISLDFIILSNGKMTRLEINGANTKMQNELIKFLETLPEPWLPAYNTKELSEFESNELYDTENKNIKIKVNTKVHLELFSK